MTPYPATAHLEAFLACAEAAAGPALGDSPEDRTLARNIRHEQAMACRQWLAPARPCPSGACSCVGLERLQLPVTRCPPMG